MENASKALIIAGAILLAIVIISLGLVVVNNTRSVTDDTNLNEQEKQAFNAKFTSYEGDNVSGSRVNSLIQLVISTNQSSIDSGDNHFVGIIFPSVSEPKGNDKLPITVYVKKENNKYTIAYKGLQKENQSDNTTFFKDGTISNDSLGVTTSSSLLVKTGRNYKVKFKYKDGLVNRIAVDPV